jgi:hypothetical protein
MSTRKANKIRIKGVVNLTSIPEKLLQQGFVVAKSPFFPSYLAEAD